MPPTLPDLYRSAYRIRRFEETVLDNFPKGVFFGTTHTYIGQEANAVGVLSNLQEQDIVFSNHRCHGHFLAYGGSPEALFAEMMGRAGGVCGGRGGSQHLQWRNFYSNGVQGGILPVAAGMALAEKQKRSSAVTCVFIGDGTLGEGALYETLNLASLWHAPVLFVVENNHIAQTTPAVLSLAGSIPDRFTAFGIPVCELDTSSALEISPLAEDLITQVRSGQSPRALILHTQRFGPHSKGDDTRDPSLMEQIRRQRDPLVLLAAHLPDLRLQAIQNEVDSEVAAAFQRASASPFAALQANPA